MGNRKQELSMVPKKLSCDVRCPTQIIWGELLQRILAAFHARNFHLGRPFGDPPKCLWNPLSFVFVFFPVFFLWTTLTLSTVRSPTSPWIPTPGSATHFSQTATVWASLLFYFNALTLATPRQQLSAQLPVWGRFFRTEKKLLSNLLTLFCCWLYCIVLSGFIRTLTSLCWPNSSHRTNVTMLPPPRQVISNWTGGFKGHKLGSWQLSRTPIRLIIDLT